jgi:hypothetical protein
MGLHFGAFYTLNNEPTTVQDAKQRDDWAKWESAMNEEMKALNKNHTWILVDRPPNVRSKTNGYSS